MKICKRCAREKPLNDFSPSNQCKDGRMAICRHCRNASNRIKRDAIKNGIHYVYALIDPITLSIRYIGRTAFLNERVKWHMSDARLAPYLNPRKALWLNTLAADGLLPTINIIETCAKDTVAARERYWIEYYRKIIPDLLNGIS